MSMKTNAFASWGHQRVGLTTIWSNTTWKGESSQGPAYFKCFNGRSSKAILMYGQNLQHSLNHVDSSALSTLLYRKVRGQVASRFRWSWWRHWWPPSWPAACWFTQFDCTRSEKESSKQKSGVKVFQRWIYRLILPNASYNLFLITSYNLI